MSKLSRAALFAGALVFATPLAAPLAAEDLTPVRFTLDWKFEGPSAPFFVAIDNGYFEDEGLDVTIDTGAGSREAIPRVATGAYEMGFGDLNALVKFLADQPDAAVEGIFMVYDKPPFAVIGRKSQGVTEDPKSLEGKTLGAPPPDAAFGQWAAFVDAAGIDTSDITIENVGFPVREPMLAQGKVDAIFGYSFSSVLNLLAQGVAEDDIVAIMMADNGLDLYGNAVMVNTEWAEANPEAVEGFVRALVKGLQATVADPETAIKSVMSRNEIADEATELARLKMAIADNIVTEAVETDGLGAVDMDRLGASITQLQTSFDMPNPPAPERVFDPAYLPPVEDRLPN
ncbi:ABC transporter substrate-binding protein [Acuticoccus mangrovi]|uniref:ABC transporter substrate-binding protein n=1 Tax=Acuticoccus mangrovi TaxID=2796142 RepID=A0A934IP01_9HYPH|nr:ABC transporter substrate-binding protein [Acuticoccus mangrovi]MBJ3775410.1 ABC transporter substrate-binding protein [Acuticoccus mangrovi]